MDTTSRVLSLLLIIALAAASFVMAESATAQSTPKPSIPEFTVAYVDGSYDVPVTYSVDPYTGANITHPAYRVENKTIELTIKNQPYTPTLFQRGTSNWTANFYYNVHFKGHFSKNWIPLYLIGDPFPTPSNSTYTVLSYPFGRVYQESPDSDSSTPTETASDIQIDFQVEAMIGAFYRGYNASATDQLGMYPYVFDGETSGWSNTQTVTVPASSASSSPTPTPTVPELPWLMVLPIFLSVFFVLIIMRHRKTVADHGKPEISVAS
jgi:hypothetical protein